LGELDNKEIGELEGKEYEATSSMPKRRRAQWRKLGELVGDEPSKEEGELNDDELKDKDLKATSSIVKKARGDAMLTRYSKAALPIFLRRAPSHLAELCSSSPHRTAHFISPFQRTSLPAFKCPHGVPKEPGDPPIYPGARALREAI
jgi:hypothetical protein